MRSFFSRNKSTAFLVIFFIALLLTLSSIHRKRGLKRASSKHERGLFRFDSNTREIQVRNLNGDVVLEGNLGLTIGSSYSSTEESTKQGLHYSWGDRILLSIIKGDKNCITVDWDSISDEDFTPMDCFNMGKFFWYGGGQLNVPSWPLNKANVQMSPLYAKVYKDIGNQHFTSVVEPYWLSSSGVAIYVDEIVPLHVSINEKGDSKLCLKADTEGYPGHLKPVHLKYKMCFGNNIKSTHQFVTTKYFDKPSESISSSMAQYPVCSLKSPNQAQLTRFFRSIVIRQFSCGHIDLGLQRGLEFNKQDFQNPKSLIKDIHSRKLKVSATVNTVFNTDQHKNAPKVFVIKHGQKNSLDLANLKVRNWFMEKVVKFQTKFEIDAIRFCCGDLEFPITEYKLSGKNPGILAQNYAKLAASVSKSTDIRVGYKTQSLPLVVKIADRDPIWTKDTGLRSIIPMVLSICVTGYPFVTIGPIGGKSLGSTLINKDLYIRWMQLSVFFPMMEFITYPWEYDSDTTQISADILDIRYKLWDSILAIAKESVETGAPVIRPMWWLAPKDPVTHHLSSQFMLGDIYLVAPIVWPDVTKHDVYLPKGVWRELFGKGVKHELEVGQWITFKVDIKTVVYFECLICKQ